MGNGPPKGDSGPFPAETASRLNTACGGGPQAQLRTLIKFASQRKIPREEAGPIDTTYCR
jgi:hypothetical protein